MTDPLPSFAVPPGRIVTARSYLVDRIVPDCEIVHRPGFELAGGRLTHTLGPGTLPAPRRGRAGLLSRLGLGPGPGPKPGTAPQDRVLIDLRRNAPGNWAHILTNHLPLVFHLAQVRDIAPGRLVAVLPPGVPSYVRAALALFGLEAAVPEGAISGAVLSYDLEPWQGARAVRHRWVAGPWPRAAVAALMAGPSDAPLPKKPFLSRRDTRRISNLAEVEAVLHARGFETVHAEDLSAADQMRLILGAREVAAVHGAALAPLLYRAALDGPAPLRVTELLPCGHMTDVYRVIAAQTGAAWIGVRGRIRPDHIRPAYDLDTPFRAFSLDDFEIDPVALERAFDLAPQEAPT